MFFLGKEENWSNVYVITQIRPNGVCVFCLGNMRFMLCKHYTEETKRELKRILMYECRCNERLKAKTEVSTPLSDTYWRKFYYEQQINPEIKRIHISGCRCDERLKAKTDESKSLTYTGLNGDLEHLTIETRLIVEIFECVMGECVI